MQQRSRTLLKLPIFLNLTPKNKPDQQKCVDLSKNEKRTKSLHPTGQEGGYIGNPISKISTTKKRKKCQITPPYWSGGGGYISEIPFQRYLRHNKSRLRGIFLIIQHYGDLSPPPPQTHARGGGIKEICHQNI